MPISLAPLNQEITIARIGCDTKENTRLAALGLVKDAKVTVLSCQAGSVVLLVCGARLALDRSTAARIYVA